MEERSDLGVLRQLPFDVIKLILLKLHHDKSALLNFERVCKEVRRRCYLDANNIFVMILKSWKINVPAVKARHIFIKYGLGKTLRFVEKQRPVRFSEPITAMKVMTCDDLEGNNGKKRTNVYILGSDWKLYMIDGDDLRGNNPAPLRALGEFGNEIMDFHVSETEYCHVVEDYVKYFYIRRFNGLNLFFNQIIYDSSEYSISLVTSKLGDAKIIFDGSTMRALCLRGESLELFKVEKYATGFSEVVKVVDEESGVAKLISWSHEGGVFYLNREKHLCVATVRGSTVVKEFGLNLHCVNFDPHKLAYLLSMNMQGVAHLYFIHAVGTKLMIYHMPYNSAGPINFLTYHPFKQKIERIAVDGVMGCVIVKFVDDSVLALYDLKTLNIQLPPPDDVDEETLTYYDRWFGVKLGLNIRIMTTAFNGDGLRMREDEEHFCSLTDN